MLIGLTEQLNDGDNVGVELSLINLVFIQVVVKLKRMVGHISHH
jgi:copper(I)-binding protein